MKIYGIVPARMASSRFPGKPLALICGRPMIEHVYRRAEMFEDWTSLELATCDFEIADFATSTDIPIVLTSDKHKRCLDRVAEAVSSYEDVDDSDVVVCVQGDEPMLEPGMILATIRPLREDIEVSCSVLAMHIVHEEQFLSPDTVKIVYNLKGDVLYTSRSPIPYCTTFSPELGARRIYGILAFRWSFLKLFNELPEGPLEMKESCDSNRIFDHGHRQRIAPYPYKASFSVDSPVDIGQVEKYMLKDLLWGKY